MLSGSLCSWKISGENILKVYKSIKKIVLSEVLSLGNLHIEYDSEPNWEIHNLVAAYEEPRPV